MQPAVVDNSAVSYRCGRVLDKDGLIFCRGVIVFGPGQLMSPCPECNLWTAITAEYLEKLPTQTGAATGATTRWTLTLGRSQHSFRSAFVLTCGIPSCHFRRHLEAYAVHASAITALMNEHPCPEPLPVIEEPRAEAADPDGR